MGVLVKRSSMTFFSDGNDHYSHRVRIVLAEKGVTVDIINVDANDKPEELADLNPYNSLPTLLDRDLVLIIEHLEAVPTDLVQALLTILQKIPARTGLPLIFPMHPRTRKNLKQMGLLDIKAEPEIVNEGPTFAVYDGKTSSGYWSPPRSF